MSSIAAALSLLVMASTLAGASGDLTVPDLDSTQVQDQLAQVSDGAKTLSASLGAERRQAQTSDLTTIGGDWLAALGGPWRRVSAGKPYSIQVVAKPSFNGEKSLRFELRKGDSWTSKSGVSYRSEIETESAPPMNSVRWYRFAILLPEDFPIEDNRLVLFQWHGSDKKSLGEASRSPVLAVRYVGGTLSITMRHSAERIVHDPDAVPNEKLFKTSDFQRGKWNDFVVQAKWAYTEDGFVNVWLNGRKVVSYQGPVGYNDDVGPYVQFGLYRDDSDKTYVSYISDVRGGNSAEDVGFASSTDSR